MAAITFPVRTKPTKWYRQLYVSAGGQQQYNFDGDLNDRQIQTFAQLQTLSYWWLSAFWIHRPSLFDDRLTRGGPAVRRTAINYYAVNTNIDSRKKLSAQILACRSIYNPAVT